MIHLGDITKISGYEVPIVDCVIGGSPCQDLSIAGKRAGLAGERSGLYIEQIRLIKEMREQDVRRNNGRADRPVRPRFMVWENVPGAFSSNKGKDFAAVLEEAIRIAEPEAPDVPVPPKGWSNAGAIVGDGWSVAWRTHDAQYWGVPQRRKRISLVADFGGKSAPEILFECKSVSGNTEPGGKERKRPSEGTQVSTSYAVRIRGGCDGGGKGALVQEEKSGTLGTGNDQTVFCIGSYHSNAWKSDNPHSGVYEAEVSKTLDALNCGYPACNQGGMAVVGVAGFDGNMGAKAGNIGYAQEQSPTLNAGKIMNVISFEPGIMSRDGGHYSEDVCGTLRANMGDNQFAVCGMDGYNGALTGDVSSTLGVNCGMTTGRNGVVCLNDQGGSVMGVSEDVAGALRAQEHGHQPTVYCLQGNGIDRAETAGCNGKGWREDQCYTLNTIDRPAVIAIENHPADSRVKLSDKDLCQALTGRMGTGGGNVPMVMTCDMYNHTTTGEIAATLNASSCSCAGRSGPSVMTLAAQSYSEIKESDVGAALKAAGGVYGGGSENYAMTKQTVRRVTPLECERLQGFPDGWTDIGEWIDSKGKKHDSSDSARYKALGNSIALPFWRFLCKRISAQYARTATMASLFDGIGGFPLVWEEANGKGSAVWASEIEEFPIAVTKYHFGAE